MRNNIMKKVGIGLLSLSLFGTSLSAFNLKDKELETKHKIEKMKLKESENIKLDTRRIYMSLFGAIFNAKKGNKKMALKLINNAIDIVKSKKVEMIPIGSAFKVYLYAGNKKTAEILSNNIKKSVEEHNYLTARFLINSARDEIDTLYSFVDKKSFLEYLEKLKKEIEKNGYVSIKTLKEMQSQRIIFEEVIPLGIAMAQTLLPQVKTSKEPLKIIALIRKRLELDKILGYKVNTKPLYELLDKLEKEVKKGVSTKETREELGKVLEKERKRFHNMKYSKISNN